jgi:hypothetical protein
MLISLIILAVVVIGFDLLVFRFGADSRDGSDWKRHGDERAGVGRTHL